MTKRSVTIAKITRPKITGIVPRKRLFSLLDDERNSPVVWISAPAGSGKTTLVANYLDARKLPCLWYRVDEGDADIATFFYYMGVAAKKTNPRKKKPLPPFAPEYLQNIPLFTKRYFEEFYSRIKPPFLIVFDNYQDVAVDSGFHDVIVHGLEEIPEGINVMIISRNEPPPPFARLRANGRCSLLGWNQIQFTVEESKEVVRAKWQKNISNETVCQLHKITDGWAAGLVLLIEASKTRGIDYDFLGKIPPEEIFGYFATEIFEKAEKETQDFLLETAAFPRMTARMAERLTGMKASAHVLPALSRNNYFTAVHLQPAHVYQYHPLFREFLLSRTRDTFTREGFLAIQKEAAVILEEAGYIDDAAVIFRETGDVGNFVPLILKHAESLVKQGRFKTLEEWLVSIPRKTMEHTPWLLYWYGMCLMSCNPAESRDCFDRAFEQFRSQGEQTGMWLSWSYAVDIIFYAWEDISPLDKYAKTFQKIYRKDAPFPSPAVESRVVSCRFIIMMMRQMDHPEISVWAERVCALVQKSHDPNFRLQIGYYPAVYYYWIGDFVKMRMVINALHKDIGSETVSPLLSIFGMATEALYYFVAGSTDSCLRIVSDALKLAQKTGVHIWDTHVCGHGALAVLSAGDITTASDLIGKIKLSMSRRVDVAYYHFLSSWKFILEGDMPSAVRYAEIATRAFAEIGNPFPVALCHLLEAQVLFELGRIREAEARNNLARQIGCCLKSKQLEFVCLITDAQFALDIRSVTQQSRNQKEFDHKAHKGHKEKLTAIQNQKSEIAKRGLDSLRNAMELGREQGYVNMFLWRNDIMSQLCVKALEAGIEVEYAKSLVRKRNLIPDVPPIHCEDWPWPIKIFTLGRFVILHEDKPMQFTGKIQHKPLEMLRVLLSNRDGEASEAQMIDVLWPDTEGDAAYRSYEATLHRLRRLLGADEAVKRQGRQVSLDKRYCWVDAWAFEHVERSVTSLSMNSQSAGIERRGSSLYKNPQSATAEAIQMAEKAINIYKGHFLPEDARCEWTVSTRLRLQKKFLDVAALLGDCLEQAGQWEKAAAHYQKTIEVDNLAEAFYQRLMVCYRQLGQEAEAIKTYRRCRAVFSAALGIAPSARTEAIYKALMTRT